MNGEEGPPISRRVLMKNSALVFAGATIGGLGQVVDADARPTPAATGSQGQTKVYLLGSQGGQQRTAETGANFRAGTAVFITVGDVGYLVDAGVGAMLRLNQAGFNATAVRNVFMTHHHQDHNADLGTVMGFGWTSGRNRGDDGRRLDVYGPPGTTAYYEGYRDSLALNISDQQVNLGQTPDFTTFCHAHEFPLSGRILTEPVQIMSDGTVTVSAIRVNHGAIPTVGYRFRTPDLDVALSGDRGTKGDHLARLVHGADILFHEISDTTLVASVLRAQRAAPDFIEHQLHDHSPPGLVARTANRAGCKQLILYHLIPGIAAITDAHWTSLVTDAGLKVPVAVGHDLLELPDGSE
jgi:ribonuclease BN (tRNA processing enzyme)